MFSIYGLGVSKQDGGNAGEAAKQTAGNTPGDTDICQTYN